MTIKRIEDLSEKLNKAGSVFHIENLEYKGKDYVIEAISCMENLYDEFKSENHILSTLAVFEKESGLEVFHNVFLETLPKKSLLEGIKGIVKKPGKFIGNE